MAKQTKKPKVAPPRLTPSELDREHTKLALKRAVRREKDIQRFTKQLERLEVKSAAGLLAFAQRVANARGLLLVSERADAEARP